MKKVTSKRLQSLKTIHYFCSCLMLMIALGYMVKFILVGYATLKVGYISLIVSLIVVLSLFLLLSRLFIKDVIKYLKTLPSTEKRQSTTILTAFLTILLIAIFSGIGWCYTDYPITLGAIVNILSALYLALSFRYFGYVFGNSKEREKTSDVNLDEKPEVEKNDKSC